MSQKIYISSAYWMRNMETIQIGLMLELQRTNVHLPTLQNQLFFHDEGVSKWHWTHPNCFSTLPLCHYIFVGCALHWCSIPITSD